MALQLKCLIYIEILMIFGIFLFRRSLAPAYREILSPKEIILVLLTPAVAMLIGNIYIFDVYLACAVGLTSRTRGGMFCTYIIMLPLVPFLNVEARVGGAYLLPISSLTAMNFGTIIGIAITNDKKYHGRLIFEVFAFILFVMQAVIALRVIELNNTIILREILSVFLNFYVPFIIASRSISSRDDFNRTFGCFIFSGFICAIVTIFQAVRHWVLYEPMYSALHVTQPFLSALLSIRGGLLRSGGTLIDYTAGGMFMACVLVVLPGMKSIFRPSWQMVPGILILAGLFLTQSRGAWIALTFGWLACMAYRGYVMRSAVFAATLVLVRFAIFPVLALLSANTGEMLGVNGHSLETADYRADLLKEGLQQIVSHPWFGQSPAQLRINLVDLTQGEGIVDFVNTHLFVAMASGLIGFAIWTAIWVTSIAMPWFNRPRGKSRRVLDPAEMPMAIIVTAMVALAFTSTIDRNMTWPVLALGLMGPALSLRPKLLIARSVQ